MICFLVPYLHKLYTYVYQLIEFQGVICYMDDLVYTGFHAGRVLLRQNLRNGSIVIRKDLHGNILAILAYIFNVIGCNVFIEHPPKGVQL